MNKLKFRGLSILAIGLALAGGTATRAAEAYLLKLPRPMVVAGVKLRAGEYSVQWDLQDPRATVTFSRKGRVVATVPGVVSKLDKPVSHHTLFFSKCSDGSLAVNGLGFAGTDKDIIFPVYPSRRQNTTGAQVDPLLMEDLLRNSPPPRVLELK